MNLKPIFQLLYSMLLWMTINQMQAQVNTIFTTDHTWSGYSTPGRNLTALGNDVILAGTWGPVVENATLPGQCIQTTLTHPGIPIFSPGNAVCYDGNVDAIFTSYFKKEFTLSAGSAPLCTGVITVRADNNFRVYVDGTLIEPEFDNSSCSINWDYKDLSGWNWLTIYTIDIMPYINLSLTTHTILFEVGNCDYVNYLAASIAITQELNCTPNAQINYNFFTTDAGSFLNISGLGKAGCFTHEDWRVYVTPSLSSPYTLLYTVDNSTRIGTARQVKLPSGCNWYRIFHRAKYTKCDGTVVKTESLIGPFYYCTPYGLVSAPQTVTDDASWDVLNGVFNNIPEGALSGTVVKPSLPDVLAYPNPAHSILTVVLPDVDLAERIKLIDLQGRTVFEQQTREQYLEIDCTSFPSGVYTVQVIYPNRGVSVQKVQINH